MSSYVGFREGPVIWAGAQRAFFASSPRVQRGFCPRCGVPLSYQGAKWPGEAHLFLGVFENPEAFGRPSEAFTGEALSWLKPKAEG